LTSIICFQLTAIRELKLFGKEHGSFRATAKQARLSETRDLAASFGATTNHNQDFLWLSLPSKP
jgi:hypothetical protein